MIPIQFLRFLVFLLMGVAVTACKNNVVRPDLTGIGLLRGDLGLCGDAKLGEVDFAMSCNPATRETFDLGISLLHSFEYEEAEKAFVEVIDADPQCAMAYWGVAMSNFHALWLQSGTDYLEKGEKILKAARPLAMEEKEADYLDAISAFYTDWRTIDRPTRTARFLDKMEALYKKYDADTEAAVFYALALCAAADPTDKTYEYQKKSGRILEGLLADHPNHPGIAHYIIHNYDYPELAELALPTARRYAQIAPASAHAQHMPSHIFTRLGLWDESIKSNHNSIEAAQCYAQRLEPDGHWDEELHGMDYLVYAYLQTGDNDRAKEQLDYLRTIRKVFPENFKIAYAVAAIPARLALENKDWNQAASLQLPELAIDWKEHPWEEGVYRFARSLGAARSGDKVAAQQEIDRLEALHDTLDKMKDAYKSNQVLIQIKAAKAWLMYAEGDKERALSDMAEAAEMEAKTNKHPVTPGEVLPAGELLGDMLLEAGQPVEALKAYEADLMSHPNRFNGIYGAGRASELVGDLERARDYYGKLVLMTSGSRSDRPEVVHAKRYLEKSA